VRSNRTREHFGQGFYDKGARVLRLEVVVHNAKELRCGEVMEKLPVLLERMSEMLVGFLNTMQVAHLSFLGQGTFERRP
jgi:hypothetical protein